MWKSDGSVAESSDPLTAAASQETSSKATKSEGSDSDVNPHLAEPEIAEELAEEFAEAVGADLDDPPLISSDDSDKPRWRVIAMKVARVAFTLAIIGAVSYATISQWNQVEGAIKRLSWLAIGAAFVAVLAALAAQTMTYRSSLGDLGHHVGRRTAANIYLVGLLAKYLPGSVWAFVLQAELGKRAGVPRTHAFLGAIISLCISTTAALWVALIGLPVLDVEPAIAIAVCIAAPVALACIHPAVLSWVINRLLKLLRRPPLTQHLSIKGIAIGFGFSTLAWLAFGFHIWALAGLSIIPGPGGYLRCVAAISLGLTAGVVAFLIPSGLGVREAMITAALVPFLSTGAALGVALVSRLLFTIADVTAAGIAAISARRMVSQR